MKCDAMRFQVKASLTDEEINAGLNAVVLDGMMSQIKMTLTESVFLVSFAILLGASNSVVGVLAAIPPLAQLLQIPSVMLVERVRVRRMICVVASTASRLSLLLLVAIPFLADSQAALPILILAVIMHATFGAPSNVSWNSWMRDLVPEARLGQFFSRRLTMQAIVGMIATLVAGYLLGTWSQISPGLVLYGYSIVFGTGLLAGMVGVYVISTIPEPQMSQQVGHNELLKIIREPLRDLNFRNLMIFSGTWSFATTLVAPFFTVYMLVRLGISLQLVTVLTALTQLMNILFYRFWGRLSDRFCNKSVLRVTIPMFLGGLFLWTFTTMPETHLLTFPLLFLIHLLLGVASAGINLASANMGLKLAPRGAATHYLASWGLVNSLAAAFAPLVGGIIADLMAQITLSIDISWSQPGLEFKIPAFNLSGLDFLFMMSFMIGLYSVYRLVSVHETGEIDEKILIDKILADARRSVRSLSTVDGLRTHLIVPLSHVRQILRKPTSKTKPCPSITDSCVSKQPQSSDDKYTSDDK